MHLANQKFRVYIASVSPVYLALGLYLRSSSNADHLSHFVDVRGLEWLYREYARHSIWWELGTHVIIRN